MTNLFKVCFFEFFIKLTSIRNINPFLLETKKNYLLPNKLNIELKIRITQLKSNLT